MNIAILNIAIRSIGCVHSRLSECERQIQRIEAGRDHPVKLPSNVKKKVIKVKKVTFTTRGRLYESTDDQRSKSEKSQIVSREFLMSYRKVKGV